ncbi:MAG: rhodanese-related sulfurtransferase [Flavobacteriales bacterium]|nr:rhodanese-related sulfurtransferase [Flavobacteriales bacterium]MBK6944588.1 rhodanese-related sulfurtransferase [Flavobacteriales bacterium]MBK7241261.1 rhodanese-related sulfurtransferase [Flavobacteriales bacterium]MBK9534243.1 rhodanese-related sulfurtransferase [Flavobacteriales bacterium]HQV53636.1 rhodanese-related sulfurtransferase [Flavobacteriales bacterium]
MKKLQNTLSAETLKHQLESEGTPRTTLSFYQYVHLPEPQTLRNAVYVEWSALGVLGRIYLANEGVNAQLSLPTENLQAFRAAIDQRKEFKDVPFKIAVEDEGYSFLKLTIKVRPKLVADGLADDVFDTTNVGEHLDAKTFNQKMGEGATVVDMRNNYEAMIGHFEGALLPKSDTFRGALEEMLDLLKDKKDEPLLMYCTGGIRCEKASAWFRHHGYTNVGQLHGGIIDYARQVKAEELTNRYKGQNFVFDGRLAERISDDVVSNCMQCGVPNDRITNCQMATCNLLLVQCKMCASEYANCCSPSCREIHLLPEDIQREWRKGRPSKSAKSKAITDPEALRSRIKREEELLSKTGTLHPELRTISALIK